MRKTILKAITYRALGSGSTLLAAWLITGSLPEAGGVTVALLLLKTAAYVVHERAWSHLFDRKRGLP